jgi:hypothetical protein
MYITNDISLAALAIQSGVDRIFVDLEILGKIERQGHLNTVISKHTLEDVKAMREAFPSVELLVRINPFHDHTEQEIENILVFSPQFIMLPMYRSIQEVQSVADILRGRAGLIPLVETPEALNIIDEVCSVPDVVEVYLGMNDLHLALGRKFMFELLVDGTVENFSNVVKSHGKRLGFGGIARIGEGLLPAEYIIGEHERLGSSSVILSRTFHRKTGSIEEREETINYLREIEKIRLCEKNAALKLKKEKQENIIMIKKLVKNIVENL